MMRKMKRYVSMLLVAVMVLASVPVQNVWAEEADLMTVIEETDETTAADETPAAEETAATETTPSTEETTATETTPSTEETTATETTPSTEETTATESETVTTEAPKVVTALKLNKSSVSIIRGKTYTLKATITGGLNAGESLTWSSSNKSIATVSSKGKITAVADGTVKITVKAPSGVKATCTVYVCKPTKVTLDKTSVILVKGATAKLAATIAPTSAKKAELTWSSSNTKVATVSSSGKITAVKDGTAVITVETANGKKATCKVIVATPSKIKLNKTSLTLTITETYSLKTTLTPSSAAKATLTWSSSNKKVATVSSSGKVKAIKSGTATITVKSANGKKATCKVTVITPKTVKLNKTSYTGLPGQSFTLSATVSPTSAKSAKITWKSSNTKVATVSSAGKVKLVGTGTAKITATTLNGKKATCTITSKAYSISNGKLSVGSKYGVRTYTLYGQYYYGSWYKNYGCVTTAVSIAASAFGKNYTPKQIHEGSATAAYSERYAVSKMGASAALYGYTAISVRLASQILTDMGIPNTPVYSYTNSAAIKQITEHLAQGKPVIVKANNTKYGGVQIANAHHSMVLVGIDEKGNGIFIEPFNGSLNYAHGNGTYFSRTVTSFVKNHMTSATGNVYVPYVTSLAAAGGYILVG